MSYTLRPYQQEAVAALWRALGTGMKRPLIVAPTGSGKSLLLAQICRDWVMADPDVGILVATHVKELVAQNAEKLVSLVGEDGIGVHSAGLARRDVDQRVIVGGVQSLINRVGELGRRHVLIVDEAHRIPREGDGQYQRLMKAVGADWMIGLTATHYRMDSGELHKGKDALFDGIAYEIKIPPLIEGGFLSKLKPRKVKLAIDLDGATIERGDFVLDDLRLALNDERLLDGVVGEWTREAHEKGRKSTLVFCATVEQAENLMGAFQRQGHAPELITGETKPDVRQSSIERFKSGELPILVNVMVLTTGFDAPNTDCLVCLRPTASTGLYVQIMGRGMRVAAGKEDCLVLDYGKNVERHGPVDAVSINTKKSGEDPLSTGGPMIKYCDHCEAANALAARKCCECGEPFPIKVTRKASPRELLDMGQAADLQVVSTTAARYMSSAGNECVRVDYWATPNMEEEPPRMICEYFAIQHGIAQRKLVARLRLTQQDIERSDYWVERAQLALKDRQPTRIRVRRNGKFHDVLECDLEPVSYAGDLDEVPF